jgi:hypothetical protein
MIKILVMSLFIILLRKYNCENKFYRIIMNLCLPLNYALVLICLSIGLGITYIHLEKKKNINYNDTIIDKVTQNMVNLMENNYLKIRDEKVFNDVFSPPERRQPKHAYFNRNVNIPTRGEPDNYQLIGVVFKKNNLNHDIAYNLFGRQKFLGSNQYEYYIAGNMNNTNIKIPIKIKGDREIEDNQTINIPEINSTFNVKLYDYDSPRYNPNII